MAENVRRISLRFTPEHFDKLDEKRFRSRLSFQQLGLRLFNNWLTGDDLVPLHGVIRKPAPPLLEKVAILEASGDKGALALAQKAIDISFSVLQQSVTPEELAHFKAVAYGEAQPAPPPPPVEPQTRRGRPRKTA